MPNGNGGKMRVADHVPVTADTDQEATEQGPRGDPSVR